MAAAQSAGDNGVAGVLEASVLPEITFVAVAAGLVLLAARIATPALGWPALTMGLALLLGGCIGLATLPVTAGGVALLALAGAAMVMEVRLYPGIGLHAAGSAVGLILAGILLTERAPGAHPGVVAPIAVLAAGVTYLAGRRSWRFVRDRALEASGTLVGRGIVVLGASGSTGHGVVSGALWPLRTRGEDLRPGQPVRVTEAARTFLVVEPVSGVERR